MAGGQPLCATCLEPCRAGHCAGHLTFAKAIYFLTINALFLTIAQRTINGKGYTIND